MSQNTWFLNKFIIKWCSSVLQSWQVTGYETKASIKVVFLQDIFKIYWKRNLAFHPHHFVIVFISLQFTQNAYTQFFTKGFAFIQRILAWLSWSLHWINWTYFMRLEFQKVDIIVKITGSQLLFTTCLFNLHLCRSLAIAFWKHLEYDKEILV